MADRRGDILLLSTPSPASSKCQSSLCLSTSCYLCKHKVGLSHISVITITQQSWMFVFVYMVRSRYLILLENDLAFVTKRLGNESLCRFLPSLALILAWQPRFCLLSQRRLRRFPAGWVIHADSGGLTSSNGMSGLGSSLLKIQFMGIEPMSSSLCWLYFSFACAYVALN